MPRPRVPRDAPGPSPRSRAVVEQGAPALTEEPLGDSRVFNALSSTARLHILSSLTASEKTVAELARELRLHRITVRYHLNQLLNQGLVEETRGAATGRVGRPPLRYRATQEARVGGFPPRRYELLGRMALEVLRETLGDRRCVERLREKGAQNGRALISGVAEARGIEEWTPELFQSLVLEGVFREQGVSVQVLGASPTGIAYRSSGCPFLELAKSMPDIVCEGLDTGFHDGIGEVLGCETERVSCMGHGAAYCEYRMTWRAKPGRRAARRRPAPGRAPVATT